MRRRDGGKFSNELENIFSFFDDSHSFSQLFEHPLWAATVTLTLSFTRKFLLVGATRRRWREEFNLFNWIESEQKSALVGESLVWIALLFSTHDTTMVSMHCVLKLNRHSTRHPWSIAWRHSLSLPTIPTIHPRLITDFVHVDGKSRKTLICCPPSASRVFLVWTRSYNKSTHESNWARKLVTDNENKTRTEQRKGR